MFFVKVLGLLLLSMLQLCDSYLPIILVPGYLGSRLEASINKTGSAHSWCDKKDKHYLMWVNIANMLPPGSACLIEDLSLKYNNVTRLTSDADGVNITVPGFGNTKTIEYLDLLELLPQAKYMNKMVDYFVERGYMRNKSLRGAPYDWRKAPNEQGPYFLKLKNLVEDTYVFNDYKKVVLVGHSMGSTMLLQFLSQQSSSWKEKYVKSLVTLSGPFSGSVDSLGGIITGGNLGSKFLNITKMRSMQRTWTALSSFIPSSRSWGAEDVLVQTPNRNYTSKDYEQLFKDLGYTTGYEMWKDTAKLITNRTVPGVEAHCLYGSGHKTVEGYVYDKSLPTNKRAASVKFGEGDGSVNKKSLEICHQWSGHQTQKFFAKRFENVSHSGMINTKAIFDYILNVAQ